MGGTGPTCILLQGFHIMSVTDKTQKTENPETTFAKPLDVVKDSDLSCQQKAKTLDTWEQDARELYRKDAQMTKKTLDWTPDLELPAGRGAKVISRSMPRKSPALQATVIRLKSFEILKRSRRITSAHTSKCRKV